VLAIAIAAFIGCGKQEGAKPAGSKSKPATAAPSAAPPRTEVGDRMPPYKSSYLDGSAFDIAEQKAGQLMLLNVWATWCGPCRAEIPELQKLHDEFSKEGFRVVGVSIDETDISGVKQFVEEHKVRYPIAFDPEGRVANILQTTVLPTSVLLDSDHRILWRKVGFVRPNDLEVLRKLIAKKPPKAVEKFIPSGVVVGG
jgi:thiol-disulfide isomerase/thioredoxin